MLKQHVAAGRLLHLRRGLYASVPRGVDPERHPVDPYLLATQLAPDGVVAYHAALQFHGKVYSLWNRFHYLTAGRQRRFSLGDQEFVPVQMPAAVRDLPDLGGGVVERPHAGGVVRVTTLERCLVDVLDAPERNGGWEECQWRFKFPQKWRSKIPHPMMDRPAMPVSRRPPCAADRDVV